MSATELEGQPGVGHETPLRLDESSKDPRILDEELVDFVAHNKQVAVRRAKENWERLLQEYEDSLELRKKAYKSEHDGGIEPWKELTKLRQRVKVYKSIIETKKCHRDELYTLYSLGTEEVTMLRLVLGLNEAALTEVDRGKKDPNLDFSEHFTGPTDNQMSIIASFENMIEEITRIWGSIDERRALLGEPYAELERLLEEQDLFAQAQSIACDLMINASLSSPEGVTANDLDYLRTAYNQGCVEAGLTRDLGVSTVNAIGEYFIFEGSMDQRTAYEMRSNWFKDHPSTPRVKQLYLECDLASLLLLGDWKVNRLDDLYAGMGVVHVAHAQATQLGFYKRIGALESTQAALNGRLNSFVVGPGNGLALEDARSQTSVLAFEDGAPTPNYYKESGIGDRLYVPLSGILRQHLKPVSEWPVDSELSEEDLYGLIDVMSTLILRGVADARAGKKKNRAYSFLELPRNFNNLRKIILDFGRSIDDLEQIIANGRILRDIEFTREADHAIPESALNLIGKLFLDREMSIDDFLKNYFDEDFLDEAVDLATQIEIYPHNIYLGLFQDVESECYPHMPDVHISNARRSTSHLNDGDFYNWTLGLCRKLAPGGMNYADDGVVESYTRCLRIGELEKLESELNAEADEYRFYLIVEQNDEGENIVKSFHVQRAYIDEEGCAHFLNADELNSLLAPGHTPMRLSEYSVGRSQSAFRNEVRKALRDRLFVGDESDYGRIRYGRDRFRGITDQQINEAIRKAGDEDVDNILNLLARKFDVIGEFLAAETNGGVRVGAGKDGTHMIIHARRAPDEDGLPEYMRAGHKISMQGNHGLPRNHDLTRMSQIETTEAFRQIIQALEILKRHFGKAPILLVEFAPCFTNESYRKSLKDLLGNRFDDLVEVVTVNTRNKEHMDKINAANFEGRLVLLGGSVKDANDDFGKPFVDALTQSISELQSGSHPHVSHVSCFGLDAYEWAYARTQGIADEDIRAGKGALQVGWYPVRLDAAHGLVEEQLDQELVAMMATRNFYVHFTPSVAERMPDRVIWAREVGTDINRPPVGVAWKMNGAVTSVGCKFHMEMGRTGAQEAVKYVQANIDSFSSENTRSRNYGNTPSEDLLGELIFQIMFRARDRFDEEVSWVRRKAFAGVAVPQYALLLQNLLKLTNLDSSQAEGHQIVA